MIFIKRIKVVNLHSQNENVLNPQNVHLQKSNFKKQEQAGVKDVQTPSSPQLSSSPLSEGEDDSPQLSPSKVQPVQAEPKDKASRRECPAAQVNCWRSGATRKAPSAQQQQQ